MEVVEAVVRFSCCLSDNAASDMSITLSALQTRKGRSRPSRRSIDGHFFHGNDSLSMSGNNVWHMDIDDGSG